MYISASAPEAPPFSETTIGCFIRLFFWIAACIIRAIWSDAPPAPAATTISTGLLGSQPAIAGALRSTAASAAAVLVRCRTCLIPQIILAPRHGPTRLSDNIVRAQYGGFKQALAAPPAILALDCSALKEQLPFELRRPLVSNGASRTSAYRRLKHRSLRKESIR